MKLFLWRQKNHPIESETLLMWAIEEYEAAKQNLDLFRESDLDSLFEFAPEGNEEEGEEGDLPFRIVKEPGGKPAVVDKNGEPYPVHVSVTHTGDWLACAVGDYPMGIDAELKDRSVKAGLIRRICTEDEVQWLEQAMTEVPEEQKEEWLRQKLIWLWVRKEAYVKYLGTGIGEGLKTFSVLDQKNFTAVDVVEELELVVYSPEEEVEEIRWMKW